MDRNSSDNHDAVYSPRPRAQRGKDIRVFWTVIIIKIVTLYRRGRVSRITMMVHKEEGRSHQQQQRVRRRICCEKAY